MFQLQFQCYRSRIKKDKCLQRWWTGSTTVQLPVLFLESALPHYSAALPCSSGGIQAISIARQPRKRLHSCQSSNTGFSVEGGKQRRYFNVPSFQALLHSDQSTTQAVFHWESSQPLTYWCHVFSFSLKRIGFALCSAQVICETQSKKKKTVWILKQMK